MNLPRSAHALANCRLPTTIQASTLRESQSRIGIAHVFAPAQDRLFRARRTKLLRDGLFLLLPVLFHAEGLWVWQQSKPGISRLEWRYLRVDGLVWRKVRSTIRLLHGSENRLRDHGPGLEPGSVGYHGWRHRLGDGDNS